MSLRLMLELVKPITQDEKKEHAPGWGIVQSGAASGRQGAPTHNARKLPQAVNFPAFRVPAKQP